MALMVNCLDTVEYFTKPPFNEKLGQAALSAFVYCQGGDSAWPPHYSVPALASTDMVLCLCWHTKDDKPFAWDSIWQDDLWTWKLYRT